MHPGVLDSRSYVSCRKLLRVQLADRSVSAPLQCWYWGQATEIGHQSADIMPSNGRGE